MPPAASLPVVLLVEDNPTMRALIRSLVEDRCSAVHECADGESALTLYEQVHPDLVLMDITMGGMDGIAATRALRKADPKARVIIVTEQRGEEYRRAARDAGAEGFVPKDHLLDLAQLIADPPDLPARPAAS